MDATPRFRHLSRARRPALAVLSLVSLIGAVGLATAANPVRMTLACLGFAAYVAFFALAFDGPSLRRHLRPPGAPP